jgi:hypothetical protein
VSVGTGEDFRELRAELCGFCGCRGSALCSSCRQVRYCSKQHQKLHWKAGHKRECQRGESGPSMQEMSTLPLGLFHEFELVVEAENVEEDTELAAYVDEGCFAARII